MSWERGRAEIERLLGDGELEHVTPSADIANRLLEAAEAHVGLADKGTEDDPAGALQLSYDAARKASAALLAWLPFAYVEKYAFEQWVFDIVEQ